MICPTRIDIINSSVPFIVNVHVVVTSISTISTNTEEPDFITLFTPLCLMVSSFRIPYACVSTCIIILYSCQIKEVLSFLPVV